MDACTVLLEPVKARPNLSLVPSPSALDDDSRDWLRGLRSEGLEREETVERLHLLLLRAARFEVARRRPTLPHLRGNELDDIAHEAAVKLRKRAWQGREVPLEPETWGLFESGGAGPAREAFQGELIDAVRDGIAQLTLHQRQVLVALALNGVPIDVLAERLESTRGALYKTLHDARRALRAYLASRGFEPEDWI
jgi:RNA polymerase sigma-70 factor, ECF subfamily